MARLLLNPNPSAGLPNPLSACSLRSETATRLTSMFSNFIDNFKGPEMSTSWDLQKGKNMR